MQLRQKKVDIVRDGVHLYLSAYRIQNQIIDHINPLPVLPHTSWIDNHEPRSIDPELVMCVSEYVVPLNFNRGILIYGLPIDSMEALEYAQVDMMGKAYDGILPGKELPRVM